MSKLFKGIKKVFKKVAKVVKKVVKSKVFKYVAVAAAIYFGGAGLSSMMSGGTFSAGVGSAGASLSSAGSSLMAGEFSAAGSTVGSAWGTAGSVGGSLGTTGTMAQAATATQGFVQGGGIAGIGASTAGGVVKSGGLYADTGATAASQANTAIQGTRLNNTGELVNATSNVENGVTLGKGLKVANDTENAAQAGSSMFGGATLGDAMMVNTGVQAVGNYLGQRDQEKLDKQARMRQTYYGMDGYGNVAQPDPNAPIQSLMQRPPSINQVFNNTSQLADYHYGK